MEWETWVSEVYTNRIFQATVVGVDASNLTASALLSRFVSDAPDNFINFDSADYDAAYARAEAAVDDAEKTESFKECERLLAEHAANVYIQDLPCLVALIKSTRAMNSIRCTSRMCPSCILWRKPRSGDGGDGRGRIADRRSRREESMKLRSKEIPFHGDYGPGSGLSGFSCVRRDSGRSGDGAAGNPGHAGTGGGAAGGDGPEPASCGALWRMGAWQASRRYGNFLQLRDAGFGAGGGQDPDHADADADGVSSDARHLHPAWAVCRPA